ncbi:MAG: signal recognition particle receptor subunit alpha, partial [Candidatus Hodarchaeales archaeon]|jgi:signal recognition particle subunit SRP54
MKIRGAPIVDKKLIDEVCTDLEEALLAADVNLELTLSLTEGVRERALNDEIPPGISRVNYTLKVIYDELAKLLGKKYSPLRLNSDKTSVLMFIGIQGSGKTTSIGKMANYFQKRGYTVGVIGGDTFRPGALAQLEQYLSPINVEVYGDDKEKKSTKVIKKGLKYFREKKKINLILIDTSGRHKEETALLKEMQGISNIANPTEIILVVDATIGQQAQAQADAFNRATPIGSIILTKMDGSAKGGGAVSAVSITGAKIRFYGEGEKIQDLEEFNPSRYVGTLLGMGDIEGLVQSVNDAFDEEDTVELRDAFKKGKLTLRHFKKQMEVASKQSSISKMVSKIPGVSQLTGKNPLLEAESQKNVKRFIAICSSMTEEELDNSRLIKGQRIQRIARGSGTSPQEVKLLLTQFNQMTKQLKMMRKMRGRRGAPPTGVPPGMEGLFG